ncbi:primosomal protein N' [Cellvibrio japonicus]|uniref:Replication restart protein PriA n=1 Tax=Cellvibrio japonicus (strain Ueda107) TaxID=498211 RepID=B3PI68_CELJU|nr:primosomal protein N' [Cellvibrio japonicus]ACE84106.1 primosomal protein N` [Cellvibrio japonicus Ueda107]QEI11115.1 primosomal protein N' [Cellvibrio japonicus]QEI14689.1 primosomal protein N' [Cellvibrio japonicus]QEI18269.1 primosomal protein N' [Cellvibrio japonicus]
MTILEVALPTPLRRRFDYLLPGNWSGDNPMPGSRVKVPFGNQELIGLLITCKSHSHLAEHKLKPALEILDEIPVMDTELLELSLWAADYYQCAPGEALQTALPVLLRQGVPAHLAGETVFTLTPEGKGLPQGALKRSPKQAALLAALQQQDYLRRSDLAPLGISRPILKQLQDKGLVETKELLPERPDTLHLLREQPLVLGDEQTKVMASLHTEGFTTYLLDGATGSGKTEIYLQAIEKVLTQGKQALVLVPEIGLTPQTLARFHRRFAAPVVTLHSGLNDRERLDAWLQARAGHASIIIGTRSAIFTPLAKPGIIIVDEEHDGSFKQQDGFRYSARDLAVMRAQRLGIPLILGSATPSLESLHNAQSQRYQHLQLRARAGSAIPPELRLLDIRNQALHEGFAAASLAAIDATLKAGNQVLVFLNRRGYAPALECHACGWLAQCNHCDARLTLHQSPRHLHCHHCDHQRAVPHTCPECKSPQLFPLGQGTERSESALQQLFPQVPVIRVDRDSTRAKDGMQKLLAGVHQGIPCILVGTQMLAKGHHFADVTLVVIIDADAGLFSTDFRGPERMGQLLLQVAGRAGRAEKPGQVLIQSYHSDHPLMQTLVSRGYHTLAEQILHERQLTQMPPYRHLALLRAESQRPELALQFLERARLLAEDTLPPSPLLSYLGPLPAMMEKRGDRFRYQLQFNAAQRKPLQQLLSQLALQLEADPLGRRVRWALDVDPQEM